MQKQLMFLILIPIVSSCSHKFFSGKDEAPPEVLSKSSILNVECLKDNLQSCHEYLTLHDQFKLPYKDTSESNNKVLEITSKICFKDGNDQAYCERASSAAEITDNYQIASKICFETKIPETCINAGKVNSRFSGRESTGLKAYKLACAEGDSDYCSDFFEASNEINNNEYLKQACAENNALGCYYAGIFEKERDTDPKIRLGYYKKACDLGLEDGCDYAKLLEPILLTYECETKEIGKSCFKASLYYEESDVKKAKKLSKLGCSFSDSSSCNQFNQIIASEKVQWESVQRERDREASRDIARIKSAPKEKLKKVKCRTIGAQSVCEEEFIDSGY